MLIFLPIPRTFLVFLTLAIFSSLLEVELELEDDPLPELELEEELELELLEDDDFEFTFFFLGTAGFRLTGAFFALGLTSFSDEDVPDELLDDSFFLSFFFSDNRFGFSFNEGRTSSFFFFSLEVDDELLSLSEESFLFYLLA